MAVDAETRPHLRAHSVPPISAEALATRAIDVLLVITDQERERSWVPDDLWRTLEHRGRLRDAGMELRAHYTHSSPCSPSRVTLLTGLHVPEHGVTDNVFVDPVQPDLHTGTPTLGHRFAAAGYRTAYLGKWHLSYGNPDMEQYGFGDWSGEDWAWTGLAGTGRHYDEVIAAQAASWLGEHAGDAAPWLLVVGLVNPHDIAWYPADQPDYQAAHPGPRRGLLASASRRDPRPRADRCVRHRVRLALRPARQLPRRPEVEAGGAARVAVGGEPLDVRVARSRRRARVASVPRLLLATPRAERRAHRHDPRRAGRVRGLGRHDHRAHERPRRAGWLARHSRQGSVRVRGDHAHPADRARAGCDGARYCGERAHVVRRRRADALQPRGHPHGVGRSGATDRDVGRRPHAVAASRR